MSKVVTLLKGMADTIDARGKSEQASYDKYTCWCEDTMQQKADDITKAKDKLESLQNNINKNKGGLGSGGATIAQLNKDIAENRASQKEATEVRTKENTEYAEERAESEQCIGGLEAAIKVLTGAGGSGQKFLETFQQAKIMSVIAGVRPALKAPVIKHKISGKDMQLMEQFVEKPDAFFHGKSVMGAMQVSNNPFGDYAPQSGQIQGILQSMYDTFTGDLEKDNAEEADKQKAFEALMATKKKELATLESSLEDEDKNHADSTKSVADDKAMRTSTREQLASDEDIFTATKEACAKKAKQWAQRTRSRSQELAGINEAIKILDSDEAKKTFTESQKVFLQTSAVAHHKGQRAKAYKRLQSLATSYHSLMLAQIAVAVKTTGHFDDVIVMIDKMMTTLREEEASDIAHRDRCEGKQNANKNSKADAEHEVSKAKAEIKRLETAIKDKEAEIKEIAASMKATKKTMDDITKTREDETAAFKKAQKADEDSLALLEKAEASLAEFYSKGKFIQVEHSKPEPNTNWEAGDSSSSSAGEARGVMGILDMLQEDLKKEMKSQGQDEIDAQVDYEKDFNALEQNYRASDKAKTAAEGENADLKSDKQDQTDKKDSAQGDADDEDKLAKAIAGDCDWVDSNFEKRRGKRKAEMDGLTDAKDFLAGVGTENDLDMP
jgi:peptidoglycan hydrolase CwlO-like protein